MPAHELRIEIEYLDALNEWSGEPEALAWVRNVFDDCLATGVPIVVTDARDLEIGRVTRRLGYRYVMEPAP